MTGSPSERHEPKAHACRPRKGDYALLGAVCALVISLYALSAKSGWLESRGLKRENTYYNLLVRGFHSGQLNLNREVPPGVAQSSSPYDPTDLRPYLAGKYPLFEQSYCGGKLYLYFGVTPALVLFWPYAALTGRYLLHREAVMFLFSVGFLAGVGLLWAVWRRYFATVGAGVVATCALAVGLANLTPAILRRCDVYEVPISCGYALTLVSLVLLYRALDAGRCRAWWLAGASLAYGLALGSRPSLLFGTAILLVPVFADAGCRMRGDRATTAGLASYPSRAPRPAWLSVLPAALGPVAFVGLGVLLYNFLRFDDPLEFGQRYQLPAGTDQQFSIRYLWSNFRVAFLAPARWSGHFPFVQDIVMPPLSRGAAVEQLPFGVLTNLPLVWLAMAAPLAWRRQVAAARATLRGLVTALGLLFGSCALTLCLHNSMTLRYEAELVSPLALLAILGVVALEDSVAGRRVPRRAVCWGWGAMLSLSLAFNSLAVFAQSAQASALDGVWSLQAGDSNEAIGHFRKALALQPGNARAHNGLAAVLLEQGRVAEAIVECEQGLRTQPEEAGSYLTLGMALLRQGKVAEAIDRFQEALRLQPDLAGAHDSLATALFAHGRAAEAIDHFREALRIRPNYAEGHYNLGTALVRLGKGAQAKEQLERALQLKPDFGEAQANLAWLLATCADGPVRNGARAVELAEKANQLAGGNDATVLATLAAAYAEAGRFSDAIAVGKEARQLAMATGRKDLADQAVMRLKLYESGRPYHQE